MSFYLHWQRLIPHLQLALVSKPVDFRAIYSFLISDFLIQRHTPNSQETLANLQLYVLSDSHT